jgi:signal transduction histidine kinase/ActR/RegA family two-component response regulator
LFRSLKYAIRLATAGVIYFFVVRFSLELIAMYPGATPIWPPTAFALAAVLLGGYQIAPAILAGAYFANWFSPGPNAAVGAALGNTVMAIGAGFLVNWWAAGRKAFATSAATTRFILIAIFIAGISASAGSYLALEPDTSIGMDRQNFASTWVAWWSGDLAAMLVITPSLVLWLNDWPPTILNFHRFIESAAILASVSAFGVVVAIVLPRDLPSAAPLAILAVLLLTWAALRGGPRNSATATLILAAFGTAGTILAWPLARGVPDRLSSSLFVVFLIALAMLSLILASDSAQRRQAERILADARKELTKAREQFAQSQKLEAVGQLTSGVAHDFNNLLTVVVGNLEIAQRHLDSKAELSTERLRRLINNAARGAERATSITKQLLAFSRKEPFDPKPLNVSTVVHGISDFLRRSLGETITLDVQNASDLWHATADPVQLEAAVLNLAVNARDAMAEGGKLTITTRNSRLDEKYCQRHDELAAGPYVLIAVSDTGAGMSKEILQHAFEPFFTTKKAGEGTGLGLSQVQGFAKESKGHIEIDSKPGQGTTVTIYLPALPGNAPAEEAAEPEMSSADLSPTILLVEDDTDVRAYVAEILRELNYQVLEAHDAETALALVDRNSSRVDLLLADLVLPGMNGSQLAEQLKAGQPQTKVLFMTGYSHDKHQISINTDTEILHKPLTRETIERSVRETLSKPLTGADAAGAPVAPAAQG